MSVIWHDLECGSYAQDIPLWRALAAQYGDPVLDIGAGTGRIALDLAHRGHRVTALDHDAALLAELGRRARGLELPTVLADARAFDLGQRFALCIVPMQTIQLLGGGPGRAGFLRCAARHLRADGVLAVALADALEPFEVLDDSAGPLPDIGEIDGVVYCSVPTAVRVQPDGYALERRRETVTVDGARSVQGDVIRLDRLTPEQLQTEAVDAGLKPAGRRIVAATRDYVASTVVILGA